jgi:tetratricopeptide (TPR) repeat protein
MGFWRGEVIDPALGEDTERLMREQKDWIAREPRDARPYYHLAQFYRIQNRQDEALALLLEAVDLDPGHAGAHVSLSEIYAVRADYAAAWRHARAAQAAGDARAIELLERHGAADPGTC